MSATYTTSDGTANSGSDYAATTGTVTFAPGDPATKTVTVPVNGDTVDETNEDFHVTLSSPVNSSVSGGPGTGTITDDDGPAISIANVTVPEGDSGTTMQNVTVSLSAPSPQAVTMDVSSADQSAIAGQDYVAIPSGTTLTIPAGQTSGNVQVGIIGDVNDEANETFLVNLSNAVNATFADNQGVVTIDDDDGVGGAGSQFSINDATVTEGNSGTSQLTFTVTRTLPNSSAATVDYSTAGATATSGVDFTPQSATLSFPLGTASQQVTIDVIGDRLAEADETLFVNLSNPTNATLLDAVGLGTITNDDHSPVAASQSPSTNEDVALPVTLAATDADGDALTYSIVSGPAHGSLNTLVGNSVTYTPSANYNGPDSFTFQASDGVNSSNTATVSLTVNPVNDAPVATANSATLAEDTPQSVGLPASDVDGDGLTYSIVGSPTHGTLSGTGPSRTYTPAANYNGPTRSPSRRTTAPSTRTSRRSR